MARKQKRVKKKELREDPLMNAIAETQLWLSEHGNKLAIAVIVVIVVVVAGVLLRNMRDEAQIESRQAFAEAQKQIQDTQAEDVVPPLMRVADDYEGTSGAMEALFTAAEMSLNQDSTARAIELFQRFIREYDSAYMLAAGAHGGLATAYENAGRFDEAAETYETLANREDASHYRLYALLAEGRAWRLADQPEEARDAFQTVLDEQEFGDQRTRAEEEMARLQVEADRLGMP
ncbi:MAG: Outer membrane protein assembly factor BamD [Calditrichaeota bacterium]|nr:Outer membrane protein assembly factor BamD [Calditrichota bacterium]